ncbi:hypothetical protein TH61_07065 [Rufibacter sp. DG15C]|uniref:hypothetical protein n=1 Tax=Rufibacter sp. DG15C TaxID=1379909 RepID=UPI00078EB72E|nr:hypothetical protein [Rufibacter sp. DG15C]AMM50991.1 hypothetical protein TH61_07065 [Rufibacter sp. DG15C]
MYSATYRVFALALTCLSLCFLTACPSDDPEPTPEVDDSLHLAFKTPDWERKIDCTHLDLPSMQHNATTYYTFASSASTRNSFFISFPKDSSAMVAAGNLKQYSIKNFGDVSGPFQFSFKVPVTEGSSTYLVSQEGFSAQEFNEITAIKYVGASGSEAIFQLKGKYQLSALELNSNGVKKNISGTYHFKVRTTRK